MSNAKEGAAYEREFCEMLAKRGFWAHQVAKNAAGQQPADVIAVLGDYHVLIDCKVVGSRGFPFSRIEDNQRTAMEQFASIGGECGWFALKVEDITWMLAMETVIELEEAGKKSLSIEDILLSGNCLSFTRWLYRARGMANLSRR